MSARMTEFVTEFPQQDLAVGLAAFRALATGGEVDSRPLALAEINIQSYALGLYFGEFPNPVFALRRELAAMDSPDDEEVEAAFAAVMPDASGTMKAGVGKGQWLTILKTLLPLILQLLA